MIKKPERSEIGRIQGRQKTIRDRDIRDNRLQIALEKEKKRAKLVLAARRLHQLWTTISQSKA